jgi:ribonucleoside-diphosphate reductase alpha chain
VIAPTGTIGLVMDCDTTGIEPDFALVKFKKLAGGGYFKIINRAVPEALETLGYTEAQIEEIIAYAVGHGTLGQAPGINHGSLKAKGFGPTEIEKIERRCPGLRHQVRLQPVDAGRGLLHQDPRHPGEKLNDPTFDMLTSPRLLQEGHRGRQHHVCGTMTLEGAPHLKEEHLPSSTAPTRAARRASATCRSTATSA